MPETSGFPYSSKTHCKYIFGFADIPSPLNESQAQSSKVHIEDFLGIEYVIECNVLPGLHPGFWIRGGELGKLKI